MMLPTYARWLVFAVALAARLAFLLAVRPWDPQVERRSVLVGDSVGYHELAITLAEHQRFTRHALDPPDAFRAPLYPGFVATCYRLFGRHPWSVLLAQCLVDSFAAFLLVGAVTRWFGATAGLLSGLFYALDPFLVLHASTLVSDTLFVFSVVVTVNFLSRAHRRGGRFAEYGFAAAGMGASALIRPAGQFLPAVLLLALTLEHVRRPLVLARYAVGGMLVFALVVSPWLVRNWRIFGHPFLTTSGSYYLLTMDVAPMLAQERRQGWAQTEQDLNREVGALMAADGKRIEDFDAFERSRYWQRLALRYIRREPVRFAAAWGRGMADTYTNLGTSGFALMLGRPPVPVEMKGASGAGGLVGEFVRRKGRFGLVLGAGIGLYLLVSYGAAIAGLLRSLSGADRAPVVLLAALVVYFTFVAGAGGLARYKLPAIPCYLPFTALGVQACVEWARRRGR